MTEILWYVAFVASMAEAFIFFHVPSQIEFSPSQPLHGSNFGFSMAYQPGRPPSLIVGAPHETLQGEVYICPLNKPPNMSSIDCARAPIDVYHLMNKTKKKSHNLFLGASISATPDFFLACAPHWTDWDILQNKGYNAMGACFVYNGTAHRMQGPIEQFVQGRITNKQILIGGYGWSTLSDEINNITLIAKSTPMIGDIMTLNNQEPLNFTSSMIAATVNVKNVNYISKKKRHTANFGVLRNPGYALSAGNFFSKDQRYAISETRSDMKGRITFYKYSHKNQELDFAGLNKHLLTDYQVGSMYGAALFSVDINHDGLTDLLIGAPTYSVKDGFENGAVHIFLGGPRETISNRKRSRSIFCSFDGARFGSAIASTDLDHDKYPELIVSAPYESTGTVYIISGYEAYKKLFTDKLYSIDLYELKLIQKIQNSAYKDFGYSLQVIPDLDATGCDDLVIGSPGSGKALLYPCSPSVNVTLFAKLKGIKFSVPEEDNNFTIEVCLNATDNYNLHTKVLNFGVTNEIIGNAFIEVDYTNFSMQISLTDKVTVCRDVFINLSTNEPELYQFKTEVKLNEQDFKNDNKDYRSAIALSIYSETTASLEVVRKCEGDECMPHLNSSLFWSGSSPYTLGSSQEEHLTLTIRNDGNSTYTACARVAIEGAQVLRIGCEKAHGFYVCNLPKPMKRFKEIPYKIPLNMSSSTNLNSDLRVNISLYNFCDQSNYTTQFLNIPFTLKTEDISVHGFANNRSLTERELNSSDTVSITNVFTVINSGSVTWENIPLEFDVKDEPFITKISYDCGSTASLNNSCIVDKLLGNSSININVYMELNKTQLGTSFERKDRVLMMESNIKLSLLPTAVVKDYRLMSQIILTSEALSFWHNQRLVISISVLLALIGLGVLILILIKMNFFKRKQKEKLEDLKENIRKSISIAPEDQLKDVELQSLRHREDDKYNSTQTETPTLWSQNKLLYTYTCVMDTTHPRIKNMGAISEENLVDDMEIK